MLSRIKVPRVSKDGVVSVEFVLVRKPSLDPNKTRKSLGQLIMIPGRQAHGHAYAPSRPEDTLKFKGLGFRV